NREQWEACSGYETPSRFFVGIAVPWGAVGDLGVVEGAHVGAVVGRVDAKRSQDGADLRAVLDAVVQRADQEDAGWHIAGAAVMPGDHEGALGVEGRPEEALPAFLQLVDPPGELVEIGIVV